MLENAIDHAAEAMRLRNLATEPDAPGQIASLLAAAQVHATLELANQQRLANLIAAFQMEGGPYKETNNWTLDGEDANMRIRRQVKEGLGL